MKKNKDINDEQKVFAHAPIQCLSCIYDDYHLNPYKMEVLKNWDLASFNKIKKKN